MIGVLLALQIVSAGPPVKVVYDDVPDEVVRVELFEWEGDRPGARQAAVRGSRRVELYGRPRRHYVTALVRQDAAYLIDGPFAWPDQDAARTVDTPWHRTITGSFPGDVPLSNAVEWVSPDALSGPWPRCFRAPAGWTCWGVVLDRHGVVVVRGNGSIWWTTTTMMTMARAAWGRLLVVSGVTPVSGLRVAFGYPVAPSSGRMRSMRLETRLVKDTRAVPIAPHVMWIAGDAVPPEAWIEVTSESGGPAYVGLRDAAAAPAALPLHVALGERRQLIGRTVSTNGEPAPGTLITVFRLIDPLPRESGRDLPRRVLAEEVTADDEGRFQLGALGDAEYEVVAWHSQLGRASVTLPSGATELVVPLRSSGIARGRVLVGGRPTEGVAVISVPDAALFGAAQDITDVKGGDARTGPDGRFVVTMAASGGGELRIGGGQYAVKRLPLPSPPVPVFDAGDVILADSIRVFVVLDRDPGCDVRAAGPVGRTGLQVVQGRRSSIDAHEFALPEPGLWAFTLVCRGERRSLSPSAVQVGAREEGKEIRLVVR